MAREAAAQHYLTDAFAAGHLRTPVADIRGFWKAGYPDFWAHLQRKVAADTVRALRELSVVIRLLPPRALHRQTLSVLSVRTGQYPELSCGDRRVAGQALYAEVRQLTGAGGELFLAEERIPRVALDEPPQNWRARDMESMWDCP